MAVAGTYRQGGCSRVCQDFGGVEDGEEATRVIRAVSQAVAVVVDVVT